MLEVETRFLKGPRGYDTSGLPFHSDNQTVIKERIYLDKADRDTLYDEITVIDHAMTRPYSKKQKAIRNPNPRPVWHSDVCSENNNWIKIGDEPYYPQRRRQTDAFEEKSGAAGFDLFQKDTVETPQSSPGTATGKRPSFSPV